MFMFAKEIVVKRNDGTFYFDLSQLQILRFHHANSEYNKTDFVCFDSGRIRLGKLDFILDTDANNPFKIYCL